MFIDHTYVGLHRKSFREVHVTFHKDLDPWKSLLLPKYLGNNDD